MSLAVEIVTPSAVAFSGEVEELQAPGMFGEFGVLSDHAQMLAITQAGRVVLRTSEGNQWFVVGAGFAEVGPGQVTLLVDLCEEAGTVSHGTAQQDMDVAIEALGQVDLESDEGLQIQKRIDLARARLQE
jgi:F-type H+-transporting ATPase subunit epsilon